MTAKEIEPMSDGEIYSLTSFGWGREARDKFVAETNKRLFGDELVLTEDMAMRDHIRPEHFRTAFVCEHDWPGAGCPHCQLNIDTTRSLRKAFPIAAKLEAVIIANAYGRERGKTYHIDDIDSDPAFAALVEQVWSKQEHDVNFVNIEPGTLDIQP